MRYAIISDLHANLQAWNAVHADITAHGVDRILCLGDVVGYGPRPAETLAAVYESVDQFVLGNHDAVVAGLLDPKGFNPDAQRMIRWTCDQLHKRATRFFRQVPLMAYGSTFRCTHGATVAPSKFYYVTKEKVARAAWAHCQEPVIFVGHTHKPCVHRLSSENRYSLHTAEDFGLHNGDRFIVNIGSVGMPRDRDFRACYCLYDEDQRAVYFRRVAFDLEAFRADVEARIGHTAQAAQVLSYFDTCKHRPLRQGLDFSPASSRASGTLVQEQAITQLQKKAKRWRIVAAAALVCLVFGALLAGILAWRAPRKVVRRTATRTELSVARTPADREVNLLPRPGNDQSRPPAGWSYCFAYAQKQTALLSEDGLLLRSGSEAYPLEVILPPIRLGTCRKYQMQIEGRKLAPCHGELPMLAIDFIQPDGTESPQARTKNIVEKDDALVTQYTFRVRKDVSAIRPRLKGTFAGALLFNRLTLTPREGR